MAYSARAVANEFIKLARSRGKDITHLQIQKLVYIAHGINLAVYDKPLINESVHAWQYGPYIASLYQDFKSYGGTPIKKEALSFNFSRDSDSFFVADSIPYTDTDSKELIEAVYQKWGNKPGEELIKLTHQEDSPWRRVYTPGKNRLVINNEIIKDYYRSFLDA